MKVLIACECSGISREAYRELGWDAWSCDLQPTELPGQHYQCDVREVLNQDWDLLQCHPDCTYITNSGVRWLDRDIDRWKKMWEACEFFRLFLNHPCRHVCIENPIPHKYAARWIGDKYTQVIQPWQHNEPFQKATALWLRGLPPVTPTGITSERKQACWLESPGPERAKNRSRTYPGIAKALAQQFTAHILK